MPELFLDDVDNEQPEAVWTPIDIAPWNGDTELELRPATRALLDVVNQRAKENPLNKRHSRPIDGKKILVQEGELFQQAWQEEFLDAVIADWRKVAGNPPCDREHKLKLRGLLNLVNWISDTCRLMAGVKAEADTGNS